MRFNRFWIIQSQRSMLHSARMGKLNTCRFRDIRIWLSKPMMVDDLFDWGGGFWQHDQSLAPLSMELQKVADAQDSLSLKGLMSEVNGLDHKCKINWMQRLLWSFMFFFLCTHLFYIKALDFLAHNSLPQNSDAMDQRKWDVVKTHFVSFAALSGFSDWIVICDDQTVNLESDLITTPSHVHNPYGLWVDHVHGWLTTYDKFNPCNPACKSSTPTDMIVNGYTMNRRLICLCPVVLDMEQGRTLARYKDQVLVSESIQEYMLVPVVLFHELLYARIIDLARKFLFCT